MSDILLVKCNTFVSQKQLQTIRDYLKSQKETGVILPPYLDADENGKKGETKLSLAKKCDRCGKLYEDYPKDKQTGNRNNAIRRLYKNEYGGVILQDNTIDLCEKCMSEFDKFRMKGKSSDEK